MAVGQLGLVQNQDDGLAVGGSPLQSLTRKRFHDRVADHQRIAEQARNPLIAHVGTVGLKRQSSRKLHQIRAAHIEHRRDQKRQLLALSLLRQASPKFRTDTVCDLLNTVHEARSDSTKGGTLESHTVSRRQQPSTQLIDGKSARGATIVSDGRLWLSSMAFGCCNGRHRPSAGTDHDFAADDHSDVLDR
jgi:hypothetical protein